MPSTRRWGVKSACHELVLGLVRDERPTPELGALWGLRTARLERLLGACLARAAGLALGPPHVDGLALWRYVEGRPELGAAGRRSAAAHLAACGPCRRARARLIGVLASVRGPGRGGGTRRRG